MALVPTHPVAQMADRLMNNPYTPVQAQADALTVVQSALAAILHLPLPAEVEFQVHQCVTAIGEAVRAGANANRHPAASQATIWAAGKKVEHVIAMILEARGGSPELIKCCPDCGSELIPALFSDWYGTSRLEMHCTECHYTAPQKVTVAS